MSKIDQLPDSGERREFETGSVRDKREGKGRFDLMSPIALLRYAKHMEAGMSKYGERNWEKGQPLMSYIDSAMRHINDWIFNRLTGQEDKEDHMAAAIWNIGSFMHTEEMIKRGLLPIELNDIPQVDIQDNQDFQNFIKEVGAIVDKKMAR